MDDLTKIADDELFRRIAPLRARIEARVAENWADRAELGRIRFELRRRAGATADGKDDKK
jgi:hypothetical protein